jgi:hypothetical protein
LIELELAAVAENDVGAEGTFTRVVALAEAVGPLPTEFVAKTVYE